jgi:hypothetical protein
MHRVSVLHPCYTRAIRAYHWDMWRLNAECPDSESFDLSLTADILLREEPEDEEDEDEEEQDKGEDEDEDEAGEEGYSE